MPETPEEKAARELREEYYESERRRVVDFHRQHAKRKPPKPATEPTHEAARDDRGRFRRSHLKPDPEQ